MQLTDEPNWVETGFLYRLVRSILRPFRELEALERELERYHKKYPNLLPALDHLPRTSTVLHDYRWIYRNFNTILNETGGHHPQIPLVILPDFLIDECEKLDIDTEDMEDCTLEIKCKTGDSFHQIYHGIEHEITPEYFWLDLGIGDGTIHFYLRPIDSSSDLLLDARGYETERAVNQRYKSLPVETKVCNLKLLTDILGEYVKMRR